MPAQIYLPFQYLFSENLYSVRKASDSDFM